MPSAINMITGTLRDHIKDTVIMIPSNRHAKAPTPYPANNLSNTAIGKNNFSRSFWKGMKP